MKRKKGLKAAIIMMVLIFSLTSVAYGDLNATQLTDIDKSWAKQNIVSVYEQGLMDGISSSEFKPAEKIKVYDALISIARMMNAYYKEDLNQLEEKHKALLDSAKVPAKVRKEVAMCLEYGVVDKKDLNAFTDETTGAEKKPNPTKIDVCVYLGKAFGIKSDTNAVPAVLGFKDTLFIYSEFRVYVKGLIDRGVIDANGDAEGAFNPYQNVTRETFAKMLDTSNKQFQKEKLGIETPAIGNEGDPGSGNGTVPAGNDNTGSSTGSNTGADPGTGTGTGIPGITVSTEGTPDVTGYIDEIIPEYSNLAVMVKDASGMESRKIYKVSEHVVCSLDGVQIDYYKLNKENAVNLYISNDVVTKIIAESKIQKTTGELVEINTSDKTVLTVRTDRGETRTYTITARTIVIKDGRVAGWQDLNKGNKLLLTSSYDELLEVNADGVEASEKGVIESITYSRTAAPKLVLTNESGQQAAYYTAKNVEVLGAAKDVYGLRPGMVINSQIIDGELARITIVSENAAVSVDTKGAVKFVDAGLRVITINEYNSATNQYVEKKVFAANAKIMDQRGAAYEFNNLKGGQSLSIFGTSGLDGITADLIIVNL